MEISALGGWPMSTRFGVVCRMLLRPFAANYVHTSERILGDVKSDKRAALSPHKPGGKYKNQVIPQLMKPARRPSSHRSGTASGNRKNDCHDQQRGDVTIEMFPMLWMNEGLNSHDASMHDTRPHCEPDKTQVFKGFTAGYHQEYSQRCIDPPEHLQIWVLSPVVPDPTRWPDCAERINPENED